ncbi:hypothetical protein [Gayadomonas joobiniege]|uniref:hypothetical protein n=1 Tax=Gayadomonas joobiniege TaxID=1234606 RepID=UPI0012DEE9F9|nr:hypothetical protein [Gayadomonas joobiniege]
MKIKIIVLSSVLALAACSQKNWYQGMQEAGRQQNCRDIVNELDKEKCEEQYQVDYETYQKQRQDVLNAQDKN